MAKKGKGKRPGDVQAHVTVREVRETAGLPGDPAKPLPVGDPVEPPPPVGTPTLTYGVPLSEDGLRVILRDLSDLADRLYKAEKKIEGIEATILTYTNRVREIALEVVRENEAARQNPAEKISEGIDELVGKVIDEFVGRLKETIAE